MLDISNLTLRRGWTTILDRVTVPSIEGGSLIGVLGPNGCGKSTLLKALAGVLSFQGTAMLDGSPISDMPRFKKSSVIGYLPQDLPPPSTFVAYEVVITACKAARPDLSGEQVAAAAQTAFDRLGLGELAFRPLSRMSGGQRQLVGLAQVLVRNPRLFLLDEPTSALDLKWQSVVFDLLREHVRMRAAACLVAMHDINLVLRYCDQVAVIGNGSIRAYGPPEQAITPQVLRDIYQVDGHVEASASGARMIYVSGAL
ncbi:ABC transporter ATP-binding protein [Hwanghaeella sp.]|uniref:ABC transporter ATP-binding protein n=1 Tax=Hwanghaeella sp. TaxID=2605943 RepID=UPI003CCBFCB0